MNGIERKLEEKKQNIYLFLFCMFKSNGMGMENNIV